MEYKMHTEELGEYAQALCKVQGEVEGSIKDAKNPFFKSQYSTLEACVAALKPVLLKNDFCVSHVLVSEDGKDYMYTMLLHKSEQWMCTKWGIGTGINDAPQAKGSAITYARRYTLCAITGLTQEDDDGQSSTQTKVKEQAAAKIIAGLEAQIKKLEAANQKAKQDNMEKRVNDKFEEIKVSILAASNMNELNVIRKDKKVCAWVDYVKEHFPELYEEINSVFGNKSTSFNDDFPGDTITSADLTNYTTVTAKQNTNTKVLEETVAA